MNGIPRLKHVVYDVMSDVLTYIDFNTSDSILPIFGLKTVLFHSMELLSSNHLELVTKLCPKVIVVDYLSANSCNQCDESGIRRCCILSNPDPMCFPSDPEPDPNHIVSYPPSTLIGTTQKIGKSIPGALTARLGGGRSGYRQEWRVERDNEKIINLIFHFSFQ